MASIDPSLISDPGEKKWVVEIDEIINHQLETDGETSRVSLFQVPKTITSKKPEAYEPQQIALGPIHHFRTWPYKKMEQKKIAALRKVLKDYDIKDYKLHVLVKVRKFVPMVRSCYDLFLEDDDDSLARIFAIDGLFLLNLFHTYNAPTDEYLLFLKNEAHETKKSNDKFLNILREYDTYKETLAEVEGNASDPLLHHEELVVSVGNQDDWETILGVPHQQPDLPEVGPKNRLVAQDILMVENQIPFMVLKDIGDALHMSSGISSYSPSIFRVFCEIHSPLKLCSKSQAPSSVDHLLHYLHYSIVNNFPVQKLPGKYERMEAYEEDGDYWAGEEIGQVYKFISKIPRKEIVQAYEQTVSMLETFTQTKTLIPSASKLHDKSEFQFHSLKEDEGVQNIRIDGKDIYLPSITLNSDSEVILRNLVAYESLTANSELSFPLIEYMGLMCGLVMNKDDVKYLKSQCVITGDLGVDEVVKLFTGMSSSIPTVKPKEKSKLQEVIIKINNVYESGVRMKAYLHLKKLARWLLVVLRAIGGFVESSWKIVAFMISIVTVFMLTYQAYCDAFGCGKKTLTLPYASI